jgi:hypothetical protein
MAADAEAQLRSLRLPLLGLHKAVLVTERRAVEKVHGQLSGAEFLQIVSDPVRYGWLKPFSELILAIDDTLEVQEDDEQEIATPEELLARTRELLLPPKGDTPFGRRYLSLMQREPELVIAHSALVKQLPQP